jgi:GcrA cell cycle regulator
MMWQGWTDTCVDQLRVLWAEGCSASEIARVIGAVSRSAVLSKLHQIGLMGNRKGDSQTRLYKVPLKPHAMIESRALSDPEPRRIDGQPVTLLTCAAHDCRWPYGDVGTADFHICANPVETDLSPYCDYHRRKAFARKHADVEIPEAA